MVLFPVSEDIEIPPTDYCLRALPLFKFLLFLEVLLVVGSLVAKDFWGALSLYFVVLLGFCCLPAERGINVTRCLYYSVLVVYCGVLNLIQSVLFFKKSEDPCCFHEATPLPIKVTQLVRMSLPVVQLISAYVTWSMFKDCARALEQIPLLGGEGARGFGGADGENGAGYFEAFDGGGPGGERRGGSRNGARYQGDRQFQAFQGTGHKLGS